MIKFHGSSREEPIHFFENPVLRRLSLSSAKLLVACYIITAGLSLQLGFYLAGLLQELPATGLIFSFPLIVYFAWLRWTLFEYLIHRFVFHYKGQSRRMLKFSWALHGIHHTQVRVAGRLHIHPLLGFLYLGLSFALDFAIIFLIYRSLWSLSLLLLSATSMSILSFELLHWAYHFLEMPFLRFVRLKAFHMRHHRWPESRYGFSTLIWDKLFASYPAEERKLWLLAAQRDWDEELEDLSAELEEEGNTANGPIGQEAPSDNKKSSKQIEQSLKEQG